MARMSNARAIGAIADHEVFANNSGTLTGARRFHGWGELPAEQRFDPLDIEAVTYWVYSYDTPIAWVFEDGEVVIPNFRMSETSDLHQRMVREALAVATS